MAIYFGSGAPSQDADGNYIVTSAVVTDSDVLIFTGPFQLTRNDIYVDHGNSKVWFLDGSGGVISVMAGDMEDLADQAGYATKDFLKAVLVDELRDILGYDIAYMTGSGSVSEEPTDLLRISKDGIDVLSSATLADGYRYFMEQFFQAGLDASMTYDAFLFSVADVTGHSVSITVTGAGDQHPWFEHINDVDADKEYTITRTSDGSTPLVSGTREQALAKLLELVVGKFGAFAPQNSAKIVNNHSVSAMADAVSDVSIEIGDLVVLSGVEGPSIFIKVDDQGTEEDFIEVALLSKVVKDSKEGLESLLAHGDGPVVANFLSKVTGVSYTSGKIIIDLNDVVED